MSKFDFGRLGAQAPEVPEAAESPARSKKDDARINVRMSVQDKTRLEIFCKVNRIQVKDAVKQALDMWMFYQTHAIPSGPDGEEQAPRRLGAWAPPFMIDDHEDMKTDDISQHHQSHEWGRLGAQSSREDLLLGFYAAQTGNKIRGRDREEFRRVAELSDNAIKGGILQSVLLCRPKVHSFSYCIGAILEHASAGTGSDYVAYLQGMLRKVGAGGMAQQRNLPGIGADVADITKGKK